jgi:hypothetical protein
MRISASREIIKSATSAAIDICSSKRTAVLRLEAMRLDRFRKLALPPLMRQRKSFRARCVRALASRMPLPPVSARSFRARRGDLGWANLAEGRLRLDRLSATAAFRFFPLPRRPAQGAGGPATAFLAEDKKAFRLPSSAALRPVGKSLGCGSIAPGHQSPSWSRWARPDEKQETKMATIGSFKKSETGDYAGAVKTLTLNVKARITPVEKTNDKAPDFRIFAGRTDYAELNVMRSGAV